MYSISEYKDNKEKQVAKNEWLEWTKYIFGIQLLLGTFGIFVSLMGWMFYMPVIEPVHMNLNDTLIFSNKVLNRSLYEAIKSEARVYGVLMWIMVNGLFSFTLGWILRKGVNKESHETVKIWLYLAIPVFIFVFASILYRLIHTKIWDTSYSFNAVTFHFYVLLLPVWLLFIWIVYEYRQELLSDGLGGLEIFNEDIDANVPENLHNHNATKPTEPSERFTRIDEDSKFSETLV